MGVSLDAVFRGTGIALGSFVPAARLMVAIIKV